MSRRTLISALFTLLLASTAFADSQQMVIRGYGSVGYTVLPPSLESLDYNSTYTENWGLLNAGGGVQFVVPVGPVGIGIDAGYTTLYSLTLDTEAYNGSTNYDWYYDSSSFAYLDAMVEKTLAKIFLVQAGAGIWWDIWDYSYKHYFYSVVDKTNSDSGVDLYLGLMAAGGVEYSLTRNIRVFALARADVVFDYGVVVPLRVILGATIAL